MNIITIYQRLIILMTLNTLIYGCGGGDSSKVLSSEPPPGKSESSTIRADNPNRFHRDSRPFDDISNSTISKIARAETDANSNRFEVATLDSSKFQ
jgi:hypothetical protein